VRWRLLSDHVPRPCKHFGWPKTTLWPEYQLFLFKFKISLYNEINFLIILKSKLDECGKDYFQTMCREHVSISADLKLCCALVEWFSTIGWSPHLVIGMLRVKPDIQWHGWLMSVIHLDAFLRGVHLLPIFGSDFLPINFDSTQPLMYSKPTM
jgi:hypothetical protein